MGKGGRISLISIVVLAGIGALIFYFYKIYKTPQNNPAATTPQDDFIQNIFQAPAVTGNIVNSGISGRVVLLGGGPYEYEASLDIFKIDDFSKPFISIRTHDDGGFQVPLKPGSYVLKPIDPDGPIAPVRDNYLFMVGDGKWLQVKIEYE